MPVTTFATMNGRILAHKTGVSRLVKYLPDALGSVTCAVSGGTVQTTSYTPYGQGAKPALAKVGWVGSWGYRPTNLPLPSHYVRARHYDAVTGSWISRDQYWPRERSYAYVVSSPLRRIDPSGEQGLVPGRGLVTPGRGRTEPVFFPPDDTIFTYGHYCGERTFDRRKRCRFAPLDCADRACQRHDDCLDASPGQYWQPAGARCHCQLLADTVACLLGGCNADHDRDFDYATAMRNCTDAAEAVGGAFLAICAASSISAFFWWLFHGKGSGQPLDPWKDVPWKDRPGVELPLQGGRKVFV